MLRNIIIKEKEGKIEINLKKAKFDKNLKTFFSILSCYSILCENTLALCACLILHLPCA